MTCTLLVHGFMDPARPWTGFWLKNLVYGLYCSWPGRALCLAFYTDEYARGLALSYGLYLVL